MNERHGGCALADVLPAGDESNQTCGMVYGMPSEMVCAQLGSRLGCKLRS